MAGSEVKKIQVLTAKDIVGFHKLGPSYDNYRNIHIHEHDLARLNIGDNVIWCRWQAAKRVDFVCSVVKKLEDTVQVQVEKCNSARSSTPRKGQVHIFSTKDGIHQKGGAEGVLMPVSESEKVLKTANIL